jgi:hypothetical protein
VLGERVSGALRLAKLNLVHQVALFDIQENRRLGDARPGDRTTSFGSSERPVGRCLWAVLSLPGSGSSPFLGLALNAQRGRSPAREETVDIEPAALGK